MNPPPLFHATERGHRRTQQRTPQKNTAENATEKHRRTQIDHQKNIEK
jgi:hypothetical protein